jgi:hypothetical protein
MRLPQCHSLLDLDLEGDPLTVQCRRHRWHPGPHVWRVAPDRWATWGIRGHRRRFWEQ